MPLPDFEAPSQRWVFSLAVLVVFIANWCYIVINHWHEILGDDHIYIYTIQVRHTKIINKLCSLLVNLNHPKAESRVIIILRDAINIPKVMRPEGPGDLKSHIFNQYFITVIYNILVQDNILHLSHTPPCLILDITIAP